MMDEAVAHVWPDVHTEQADDQHPESVPDDSQWNDECDDRDPSPRALEKQVGRQHARNEEHHGGADSAALLRDLENDIRKRENRSLAEQRSASPGKQQCRGVGGRVYQFEFQPIDGDAWQGNHEDQECDRERGRAHSIGPDEKKPAGPEDAHVGEHAQRESVVDAQAVIELERGNERGDSGGRQYGRCSDGRAVGPDVLGLAIEQVRGDDRDQRNIGMQVVLQRQIKELRERPDEQQRQHDDTARESKKPEL